MKKWKKLSLLTFTALFVIGVITACRSEATSTQSDSSSKTRIYHSENGDMKVPANPKRVAVLAASYAGNFLKLGITPIAVDEYPKNNQFYEGKLDKAEVVTSDSLEKLLKLDPDLIVTFSNDKNIKKLSEIAPTVVFTYEKYNYLEQHIEIGKLVGKEKEARAWVDQWKEKSKIESEKVKKVIGKEATAMVMEKFGKDMYIYGTNWGRGTEVIYQALGLKLPKKVQQDVVGPGYKAISAEVIPEYAGDYIFVGEGANNAENSFMKTDVWKGIPAVQKNRVIRFDSKSFWFNDPISVEKQMEIIVKELTKRN
ncbi:iron-hydroxamate ABC transporter substrate-binding protein [Thermoflavimicrobium daqui]|uniref:ABC transporter substrate-binding protein n=1 Tax=Thermoflavimicrobium daqui TaxID=2137476 RepID=A0A364K2C1_9BACL|nr:iron-hydroxamate ABC transporter substrate-binding protein [Thermoflavimicrobium daqui]RAL22073.1 ABC transporter substrate-binding protein [Thermoflavimicrobium daqui]